MRVYSFGDSHARRTLRGGVPRVGERKSCSCGINDVNYPPPEQYWKNIYIDQGSFVSSILWAWQVVGVTGELRDALQKEGFEGIEFEPIEIVEDSRPSRDKKKLPLEQIPQLYRCKFLTSIPMHQDHVDRYNVRQCPECGITHTDWTPHEGREILDGQHHPGTDFFGISWNGRRHGWAKFCTERGKAFLETYPRTHCGFTEEEVR